MAGTLSLTRLALIPCVPSRLKRQVGDKPGDVYTGVLELVIRDIQQVVSDENLDTGSSIVTDSIFKSSTLLPARIHSRLQHSESETPTIN